MTFGQFLSILRARWWVVALVLGLTVATTVVVSLLLPKQYQSTASVVVDFKPDPISAIAFGGMASPTFIATQVDIIRSERVAQRVVRNLRLSENAQIRQQWLDDTGGEGSIETWLGTVFQRQMEVQPSRESSVIAISYQAPDPRFAAGLANAFAQAYIDTSLELRTDPARQFNSFFEARVTEARAALQKAQAQLSAFQKENGIIASDERLDVENARLNELSSQLTALQALATETRLRQDQAQGGEADRLQDVLNNPVVAGLRADINRNEAQLQQLSTRLGDNHPQVREARANVKELRERLTAETRKVASTVGATGNITRQREAELRRALEAQRSKVLQMKSVRDRANVIMQDVANAQRAYDAVQQRFTQTSLESQATQSNVNLLTQAVPPVEPSSPKLLLNTLLAIFLGTLLAVGTALLLELMDRRVRMPEDAAAALDLPVLGVMLKPGGRPGRKGSLMQQRLLASAPRASSAA